MIYFVIQSIGDYVWALPLVAALRDIYVRADIGDVERSINGQIKDAKKQAKGYSSLLIVYKSTEESKWLTV